MDLNLQPNEQKRVRELATANFRRSGSLGDLTKRLQDEFSWDIYRAIEVSGFMLHMIRMEFLLEAYRQRGHTTKYWHTSTNPCAACARNRSQGVALDEPFPSGDKLPPVHVGCRCVVVPFPLT